MRTNAYRYCLAALLAASMGACAVAMAGTGEPTRAPESRETPNPLADPLIGMGPVEQEVYRRVYAGEREQRGRELGWMPREELIEKTSFAKWEIDPAEFRRDLERKRRELAAMRERHFARLTGHARDEKLVARADKATRDLKALASFGKHEDWLALWQVGLLNPQRAAAARSVAEFLNAFHDALSGALREELAKPKFPHNPFGMARSASEMYLVAEAFVRAHPDFEKNEPAAFRKLQAMMGLLKDVAFQAWSFPHSANKDMRRKKPMQTATFRYSGGYTVGNFAYRPLCQCAMVFNDTRMFDIIKDVIEKSLSSKAGYFDVYESFWPDGIRTEGTLFAHGNQNYTFSYGKDYVMGVLRLGKSLRGTVWAIEPTRWDGMVDMLLDGWQWYLHKGEREISIMGRHGLYPPSSRDGSREGEAHGNRYILNGGYASLLELSAGRLTRKAEFDRMYQRIKADRDLVGNRYFWLSEDMLHHRRDQYVCVNMSSVRVLGPEGHPWNTLHNRMFGCGMTVLKRDPRDLLHIRGAWEYSALPGVTFAEGDAFVHTPEKKCHAVSGKNIYSGGVSDGMNGLCAFRYVQDRISISINKAYFAFDNRLICLGSGLYNPERRETWTTLNQCTANTEVRVWVNGAEKTYQKGVPVTIREQSGKPIAVWHDSMGYVISPHNGKAAVSLKVENRMTHWKDIIHVKNENTVNASEYPVDVFQLSILHGAVAAEADCYRYVVLFNVSPEEVRNQADTGGIEILQNDDSVQAVKYGPYTGLVFLREGAFQGGELSMTVDRPVLLMLDETDAKAAKLTYADPLLDPDAKELIVKTNLPLAGPATQGGVLHLPLPGIPEVGKPATMRVE